MGDPVCGFVIVHHSLRTRPQSSTGFRRRLRILLDRQVAERDDADEPAVRDGRPSHCVLPHEFDSMVENVIGPNGHRFGAASRMDRGVCGLFALRHGTHDETAVG